MVLTLLMPDGFNCFLHAVSYVVLNSVIMLTSWKTLAHGLLYLQVSLSILPIFPKILFSSSNSITKVVFGGGNILQYDSASIYVAVSEFITVDCSFNF